MAEIRLNDVTKIYSKNVLAVDQINLDIEDGEFMAFLGPSGCGKSSTMRMIAGLEEITGGEIWFDDRLINHIRPRDRNVAMVFETYALYPTLNVYENIAFPLRSAGWAEDAVTKRVDEIVEILEIHNILDRKPGNLSSGQAQLVGLGRALTRKPNVFVMDEPISHLDTRQRSRMRSYIKRLHIELGYTMIYVTHDQEEAMALANRIAVMDHGVIKQVGTPQEIFHNPANLYVAGFVGEPPMNFLQCTLVRENGQVALDYHGAQFQPPPHVEDLDNQPEQVIVGIRPFYITYSREKTGEFTLPARVYVVEPMGDTTVISVDAEEARMQIVVEHEVQEQPGDVLWLALEPTRILLFDTQTQDRLV